MKSMKEIREIVNASNARFWRLGDVWDDLTDAEQDRLVALAEGMAKDDTPLVRDPESWQAVAAEGAKYR